MNQNEDSFPKLPRDTDWTNAYQKMKGRLNRRGKTAQKMLEQRGKDLIGQYFPDANDPQITYAPISIGLASNHTRYFKGFGLRLPLPFGISVTAAECLPDPGIQLFVEDISFEREHETDQTHFDQIQSAEATIIREIFTSFSIFKTDGFAVLIVKSVPDVFLESYHVALTAATLRLAKKFASKKMHPSLVADIGLNALSAAGYHLPDRAALLTSLRVTEMGLSLVDTDTNEYLSLPLPNEESLGGGLIIAGRRATPMQVSASKTHANDAESALAILRARGFPHLTSFSEIEHRDLATIIAALSRKKHKNIVNALVKENARVQKMVAAFRKQDWQVFGALMLMSHASLIKDWDAVDEKTHFLMEMGSEHDGLYGGKMIGGYKSGCVLIIGQPYLVSTFLDAAASAFSDKFGYTPETYLL